MKPRVAGTPGELEAARLLASELRELGFEPQLEEFEILKGEGEARLWADDEELPADPWELTGSGEFEGPLNLGPQGSVKGQVVLVHDCPRGPAVARWAKAGALGFVWVRSPKGEVRGPVMAQEAFKRWRLIPGVAVDWEVGLRLARAKRVKVLKKETIKTVKSQNIIVEIRGEKHPERVVLFSAHYDSVPESPGGVDNLGGTWALLGLARHLARRRPEKTALLVWFGAEERGLLGSKAFVEAHPELLEKILLVVNMDVMGDPLGVPGAVVLGGAEMARFVKKRGFLKVRQGIYSSDGMPFALKGSIPSLNLFSSGPSNYWGHTPNDRWVSPEAMEHLQALVNRLADELLKGPSLPFEARLPRWLARKVRGYFKGRGAL